MRKVLVLGRRATSQIIAEQLEAHGVETVLCDSTAPLEELLSKFSLEFSDIPKKWVHPGTTLWAERPELITLAHKLGLRVIGPSAAALAFFGDKMNFLAEAGALQIPHLVQMFDPLSTVREIKDFVQKSHQSFPFVLRSVQGQGRFGYYFVQDPSSLGRGLQIWIDQLRAKQGEVILFVERYLEGARQIVIPFARFPDGRIRLFPLTDASLQCHYRKIIEFCPATRVSLAMRKQLAEWTTKLAARAGYVGVGAFEYLVDSSRAFLVEGVPRLTTNFHLWERVAGTHAVAWQLAALQNQLPIQAPSIEPERNWIPGVLLRVYAEDSLFHLPQAGQIHEISESTPYVFADSKIERTLVPQVSFRLNYSQGDFVSTEDTGLIGMVFVSAPDRKNLILASLKALKQFWVAGSIQTNDRFLMDLLEHPWVREGVFHTGFLDEEFIPTMRPSADLMKLAVTLCSSQFSEHERQQMRWAVGEQWLKNEVGNAKDLIWHEGPCSPVGGSFGGVLEWPSPESSQASSQILGELPLNVSLLRNSMPKKLLRVFVYSFHERWLVRLGEWYLIVRSRPINPEVKSKPKVTALISGRIHALYYRTGVAVKAHEMILCIESMGVLVPHALPVDGMVSNWKVKAEESVQFGQVLAEIDLISPG